MSIASLSLAWHRARASGCVALSRKQGIMNSGSIRAKPRYNGRKCPKSLRKMPRSLDRNCSGPTTISWSLGHGRTCPEKDRGRRHTPSTHSRGYRESRGLRGPFLERSNGNLNYASEATILENEETDTLKTYKTLQRQRVSVVGRSDCAPSKA